MSLTLFSYFRSSCAHRVRIVLNLKNIPYEIVPIHLLKNGGEQRQQTYLAKNPSGQVPTLLDGEHLIGQSMAIVEYLEEKYPLPPLLPSTPMDRARARQICEIINSGVQPLQNISVTQFLDQEFSATAEQKQKWLNTWMGKGLTAVEALISKYDGPFSLGKNVTWVDAILIPQVTSAKRFQVDLSPYKKIKTVVEYCDQLPAFIKASPSEQPDFEK